jgi:hypothetical protein
MNWNTITLKQYQDIYPVLLRDDLTNLDKAVRVLATLLEISEDEIDSWPLNKLNDYKKDVAFLFTDEIPTKVPKYIYANGKRYRFVHEIQKMPAARYIEAKTYSQEDLIANLHKVMASCVMPQRKTWLGWRDAKYNAADHMLYAEDMRSAKFMDVHNCVVFFYLVFAEWIRTSQDFLTKQFMTILPADQATGLAKLMAGSIVPPKSQNTSELP